MLALCLTGLSVSSGKADPTTNPGAGTPVVGSAPGQTGGREKHPELIMAGRALMRAQQALQRGAKDYGGHREKALDLTNQAIAEVKAAIAYDQQ